MNVAFTFVAYDLDVSSGTSDSLHQWNELLAAFQVGRAAIINYVPGFDFSPMSYPEIEIYESIEEFMGSVDGPVGCVEQGDGTIVYDVTVWPDWLVFGAVADLPRSDISLGTDVCLYARDAAAFVLGVHSASVRGL